MSMAVCQGYKEAIVEFEIASLRYNAIDITGQKFGKLTAVAPTNLRRSGSVMWLCKCSCGREKLIQSGSLTEGSVKSCGCLKYKKGKDHPLWKGGSKCWRRKTYPRKTVVMACPDCGIVRNVLAGNMKQESFTGRCVRCQSKINVSLLPILRGEDHPRWRGGVSAEIRMNKPEYEQWRKDVFSRDGYICQKCSAQHTLCCHHVLNFAQHVDLRTDVDNGKTLCSSCHISFHSKYGRTDNTAGQMSEFLSSMEV